MNNKENQPQIVTIGGGTGAPTIIRSLVMAGFENITAICASTDSGGRSGQIRTDERDQVISIGDLYNSMWALMDLNDGDKQHVQEFFKSLAFTNGRNRKTGYDWFYAQLEALEGDFNKVQKRIETILQIKMKGKAIPATKNATHLWIKTKSGRIHKGERALDEQQMSKDVVVDCWIDPIVDASDESINAIQQANYIVYCPGSLYGSLITNFLPKGIVEVLKNCDAQKILVPNLVSDRNQTHEFDLGKYCEVLVRYSTLSMPFDYAITPNINRKKFEEKYPDISQKYDDEYSFFLDTYNSEFNDLYKIIAENIFLITPEGRIRHDPKVLASIWHRIIK